LVVKSQAGLLIVSADPAVPAAESDQWLVFEVTDTGCGISQRGLASLFTEYVQVSVVHNLSVVQCCFQCCCMPRNAYSLVLAFVSVCSIACALLLCQQLSAASALASSQASLASSLVMQIACMFDFRLSSLYSHLLPCTSSWATPEHLTGSRALLWPSTAP